MGTGAGMGKDAGMSDISGTGTESRNRNIMELWALSGFLGRPADWEALHLNNLVPIDWQMEKGQSLNQWGNQFNVAVKKKNKAPRVLMGYSMGGRLALHALIADPTLWNGAVIISAHPGISLIADRQLRLEKDMHWARQFEIENWENLMRDWNKQDVFVNDLMCFDRQESNYSKEKLATALNWGSLGRQRDLRQEIEILTIPILWLTGSCDECYCDMAKEIVLSHPKSSKRVIEGAGHRVPWSQPGLFAEVLNDFLAGCN